MGCLKLTYCENETLFLEDHSGKSEAVKLRVWVNPERDFLGVDVEEASQGPSGTEILSKELFTFETGLFTIEAQAQYQLARNAAKASTTFFKSGLDASNKTLKLFKAGAGALGKVTFFAAAAVSIYGVVKDPTLENAAWATADIGVGAVGLFSGTIAATLATAGLAVPGLNLIIAGGALAYSGYRLYQAYNDGN